jgi:hypothetical protein
MVKAPDRRVRRLRYCWRTANCPIIVIDPVKFICATPFFSSLHATVKRLKDVRTEEGIARRTVPSTLGALTLITSALNY